jgi:hypothetical protein
MYKKPSTEVTDFKTENLMDTSTMSPGGPGTGQMEAPQRRGDIIP